jgi:hypothetical protein
MENLVVTVCAPKKTSKWLARIIETKTLIAEIMDDDDLDEATFEILEQIIKTLALMARKQKAFETTT